MKNGWKRKRLGDLLEIQNGFAFDSKLFSDSGDMPLIRIRDLKKGIDTEIRYAGVFDEKYIVNAGDLLVGMDGEFRCYEWKGNSALLNQRVCRLQKFKDSLFDRFVFYGINKFLKDIEESTGFTTVKHLSSKKISDINFPCPPLPEQRRIVAILDEAFAEIATAKEKAEQNLKNAKAVFEAYLYEIFAHCIYKAKKKILKELAEITGGYSFKSKVFKDEGKYQVIRMGNIRPGIIRKDERPVFVDTVDENTIKKALLIPGDVVITQTGTKGKRDYGFTAIVDNENYMLNQRLASIRCVYILPKFFLYFSWTNFFRDQFFTNETGTVGQGNVGIGAITDAVLPYPDLKEQEKIVAQLDSLSAETSRLESLYHQKLSDLEELKKSVLQQAFSGAL